MLKFSVPLIPARLANTFVNQSDRYFIKYFISITDTGIYSLAQKLGTAIDTIITNSFQRVFGPRRFEIVKRTDAKQTFNKIFIYHIFALVFIGLGISILIPEILKLMVTPKFYRAGPLVPLIVFSMILVGFRNHFEFGILWSKKTKYYAYVNSIAAVLNLVFNAIFISTFGLWGAIYSATLTIIIRNTLIYTFGKKYYFIKFDFKRVIKLFAVALAIYGISCIVKTDYIIVNFILKSLLMVIFFAALVLMKILPDEIVSKVKLIFHSCMKPLHL